MTNQYPNLTVEAVIDEVRNLANQRPDHVYQREADTAMCRYRHDDEPGCIMGHALANLAPNYRPREGYGIRDVLVEAGLTVEYQQRCWLGEVQSNQDSGDPWGEAVRKADARYPLVPVAA